MEIQLEGLDFFSVLEFHMFKDNRTIEHEAFQ